MVAAKWKEHMLLYLMQRKLKQLKEKVKFRESHAQPFQTKITKARNRIRDRSRGLAIMNELSHWEFERMFRMSREGFKRLLDKVSLHLFFNPQKAINSSGSAISIVIRLAATLRWFAGGSHLDIAAMFGLDIHNFFNSNYVLWTTVDAILSTLKLGFSLDPEYLKKTADDYYRYTKDCMYGCVSAIDEWVMETRCPTKKEAFQRITDYRNRKGFWGILVLAGCDSRCRFNMFSPMWPGATHDHLAWEMSKMKKIIEDQASLPEPYYFIGDDAFVNTDKFLIPYAGRGLGDWKDSYNYHLSLMRQCIERAFGILTQRWGVFWRAIRCAKDKWSKVALCAAKLHNYCIDENLKCPEMRHHEHQEVGDRWLVRNNDIASGEDDGGRRAIRPVGPRRQSFVQELESIGKRRPLHAMCNSRSS